MIDSSGKQLQDFITIGLTPQEESAIGVRPRGEGVLGLLLKRTEPLRIDVLSEHPASVGLPPNHPPIESFLGVPIRADGQVLGSLYLAERADNGPFTEADEAAVAVLADYAAVAIHFQQLLRQQSLLTHRFINILEEERRSIAYELHDGLTQYIMVAHAFLNSYASQLRNASGAPIPEKLARGLEPLKLAMLEARRLVNGLRSLALDDLGLVGALDLLIAEEKERAGWEAVEFQHNLAAVRFDTGLETAAYRVIQEALTNARKYADTRRIRVTLLYHAATYAGASSLLLEIRDWGKGFDPEVVRGSYDHLGPHSMEERVRLLHGHFEITTKPGAGTIVRAVFPLVRPVEIPPSP